MAKKARLDQLLVERGLAPSREKAQALIRAGDIRVAGVVVSKPGTSIPLDAELVRREPERFVGRGGYKLEAALVHFKLPVDGARILDIGASTGGFTDCALQHGAAHVVALDVGRGQIAFKLRQDPRVTVVEGVNARHLDPGTVVPPLFDGVVMDVSFISQRLIWPRIPPVLQPHGWVVTLVKPQFELEPRLVGKGGIVRAVEAQQQAVDTIMACVVSEIGFRVEGVIPSPIEGREGNREFLLVARPPH